MAVTERLDELGDEELTARFRSLELRLRRTEAEMAAVVAAVDRRKTWDVDGHRSIRGWLKANANWSNHQVTTRRQLAHLVATVPQVGDALASGHVGVAQAADLARARANPRCGDQLADVAEVLLEHAEQLPHEGFRTCVRRWEILADADGAHRDREHAIDRRTALVTGVGGSTHISASGGTALEAAELEAIFRRFRDAEFAEDVKVRDERFGPGAPAGLLPRTDAQRSFDALLAIFRTSATHGPGGTTPTEPLLDVIVDQLTFELALAGHGLVPTPTDLAEPAWKDRRCETSTGIPLTPEDVVQAALHGHVRRVVMDSAGVVIDLGRRQRLFTGGARVAAKLMAARCDHPGCTVPVTSTEVDHAAEWVRHNGHTAPDNATNTCRAHNRAKHQLGITVSRNSAGYLVYRRENGTVMAPVGRRPPPDRPDAGADLRLARATIRALANFGRHDAHTADDG